MKKYEYREIINPQIDFPTQLNVLGQDGWQLVWLGRGGVHRNGAALLMREIVEETAQPAQLRKKSLILHGQGHVETFAAWAVASSMWFEIMPLPDDQWEITYHAEEMERVIRFLAATGSISARQ